VLIKYIYANTDATTQSTVQLHNGTTLRERTEISLKFKLHALFQKILCMLFLPTSSLWIGFDIAAPSTNVHDLGINLESLILTRLDYGNVLSEAGLFLVASQSQDIGLGLGLGTPSLGLETHVLGLVNPGHSWSWSWFCKVGFIHITDANY